MSRLHAFGELSHEDRLEYINNMKMEVSNQHIKRKVDTICGRRVRPEVSFRDRVRSFLRLDETMKEEEKLDVAPDGKLTRLAKKQPKKKPVPEPVIEPEEPIVEHKSTIVERESTSVVPTSKGSGMTTYLLSTAMKATEMPTAKPKRKYTRKARKEEN